MSSNKKPKLLVEPLEGLDGTTTAWQEGVSVMIDSVLEPASATDKALASTQREGSQGFKNSDSNLAERLDPTEFFQKQDIWIQIFSFLGPGHFMYLASVSRRFKENYLAYFGTLKYPQTGQVWNDYLGRLTENPGDRDGDFDLEALRNYIQAQHHYIATYLTKRPAVATDTFYSVAFSSLPLAKYWNKSTKEDDERLGDGYLCETIAKHGNLKVLQWAYQKGFPLDTTDTCANAAAGGHLKVLMWVRERGCPWNYATCFEAAFNGEFEVLKWARDEGCPWNELTCMGAARSGHLEMLKYVRKKGCEWNPADCAHWATRKGHTEVAQWVHFTANVLPELVN